MDSLTDRPFPPVEGVDIIHHYIDIGGLKVHVAEAGAGEPLLMYHGWPQNWWMWRNQIAFFATHFRVIAADIRGFGWTDAPPGGYLKDELAEDLVKLIRALGYGRVRLMSHDWGGFIGFIANAKYPDLFSQHFALNICPIWPKMDLKLIPATIQLRYMFPIGMPYFGPRLVGNGKHIHFLLKRGNTRIGGWPESEMNQYSERFKDPKRAQASARLYRSFLLREFLPLGLGKYKKYRISTPSRILFGEKDFAISLSWLRGYERYVDDFGIELVPETGHFIVDERPDLVNERALQFFKNPKYAAL
jgi:pimeloyl-ACP methyl ester carboxylesterase